MRNFRNLLLGAATLSLAVTGFSVTQDALAAPFYKGKTITVLIGRPAGSGADLTVRSFLRYWSGLIPGNPKMVGKQMTTSSATRAGARPSKCAVRASRVVRTRPRCTTSPLSSSTQK